MRFVGSLRVIVVPETRQLSGKLCLINLHRDLDTNMQISCSTELPLINRALLEHYSGKSKRW